MEDARTVRLRSSSCEDDPVEEEVTVEQACLCVTLANMIGDLGDDAGDVIPLPNVGRDTLPLVAAYLRRKVAGEELDDTFCDEFDDTTLFALTMAANFLDCQPLMDCGCKRIARLVKQCRTPEEIRRRFNIVNDFTPEEEEDLRRENAWLDMED